MVKKFLLYWVLYISVMLSPQCLASKAALAEKPPELLNSVMVATPHQVEELEAALWQELTIYSLIIGIYGVWWLRQRT